MLKYFTNPYFQLGLKDAVHRGLDVGLEDVRLSELVVPVGGQPDAGQGALLGQHEVGVEHLALLLSLSVLQ